MYIKLNENELNKINNEIYNFNIYKIIEFKENYININRKNIKKLYEKIYNNENLLFNFFKIFNICYHNNFKNINLYNYKNEILKKFNLIFKYFLFDIIKLFYIFIK